MAARKCHAVAREQKRISEIAHRTAKGIVQKPIFGPDGTVRFAGRSGANQGSFKYGLCSNNCSEMRFEWGCAIMRIQITDSRERTYDALVEAMGKSAKSKAIDRAATFYTRMAGGADAVPKGAVTELLQAADEGGSVTDEEIAAVLGTRELPVEYETEWSVG